MLNAPGFNLGDALDDAEDVIASIVTVVQDNLIIASAFALGFLIPVGAKAFKKIAKIK